MSRGPKYQWRVYLRNGERIAPAGCIIFESAAVPVSATEEIDRPGKPAPLWESTLGPIVSTVGTVYVFLMAEVAMIEVVPMFEVCEGPGPPSYIEKRPDAVQT